MNRTLRSVVLGGFFFALIGLGAGCSVVMEATRPAPVRLAQFKPGESRDSVVEKLGQPVTTTTDADGANCDLYSLPLSGYGAAGKASIAFGEVAADVLTLGIAEAVSTPTEAITRNKKTPVWSVTRTAPSHASRHGNLKVKTSPLPTAALPCLPRLMLRLHPLTHRHPQPLCPQRV
jgi:hypothetical protein